MYKLCFNTLLSFTFDIYHLFGLCCDKVSVVILYCFFFFWVERNFFLMQFNQNRVSLPPLLPVRSLFLYHSIILSVIRKNMLQKGSNYLWICDCFNSFPTDEVQVTFVTLFNFRLFDAIFQDLIWYFIIVSIFNHWQKCFWTLYFFGRFYAFQTQGAEASEIEMTLLPTLRGLIFNIAEGIMHAPKDVSN